MFAVLRRTAHEGLEDGEEHARVLRDLAFLADALRADAGQGIVRERGEGREVAKSPEVFRSRSRLIRGQSAMTQVAIYLFRNRINAQASTE